MKRNSKTLLIISFVVLASIAGSTFLFYQELKKNYSEIKETKTRIETFNKQLSSLKSFETFITETEEERKIVEAAFVDQKNQEEFLRLIEDLENIGSNIGLEVTVDSSSLALSSQDKGPAFNLQAKGSFSSVLKYSLLLENLPYEISFEKVSFDKSEDGIWKGVYLFRLLSYEF